MILKPCHFWSIEAYQTSSQTWCCSLFFSWLWSYAYDETRTWTCTYKMSSMTTEGAIIDKHIVKNRWFCCSIWVTSALKSKAWLLSPEYMKDKEYCCCNGNHQLRDFCFIILKKQNPKSSDSLSAWGYWCLFLTKQTLHLKSWMFNRVGFRCNPQNVYDITLQLFSQQRLFCYFHYLRNKGFILSFDNFF